MIVVEFLLFVFTLVSVLILIGLLYILGKFNRLSKELTNIYAEEHDIKKRVEQYVSRKTSDELSKLIDSYRHVLDGQSREIAESMKQVSVAYSESIKKYISDQEGLITKQTEYIVGELVAKTKNEIDLYKRNQMEGVDVEVKDIVERVVPEILGKSISLSEHEEFIWSALEEAKRNGILQRDVSHVVQTSRVPAGGKLVKTGKVNGASKLKSTTRVSPQNTTVNRSLKVNTAVKK